ncbi:MAG: RNA-binding protein [Deltaproteobacteria bacterium]|nr:RNA-binding protein [Deltaproteobacteria bacterium]
MNIYVGNLGFDVDEKDLEKLFSEFGTVSEIKIITEGFSGRSKGFGFVEIPDNSEADKAIKALNGFMLKERSIKVNQAEVRKKQKSRRPRF